MSVLDFAILVIIAAVCGAVGQALVVSQPHSLVLWEPLWVHG